MRYVFAALAGLFSGGVATLVVGLLLAMILSISQAEGAYAMGLIFFWVPLGAVAGAIVWVVAVARRR